MRSLIATLLMFAGVLVLGCDGGSARSLVGNETPASGVTGTPGAAEAAAATGTPAPAASTAQPTQSGPPVLRSSISGTCRIVGDMAEIRVEYSVAAFGSTQLNRVRLLENGVEVEDSGPLQQREFRRIATFKVDPGVRRTYRVAAEAPGASATNVQSTVQCGTTVTATPGPRA